MQDVVEAAVVSASRNASLLLLRSDGNIRTFDLSILILKVHVSHRIQIRLIQVAFNT